MTATMTETVTEPPPAAARDELDGYDEEQVRLMEERCILVDPQDTAYGEDSKKTCTLTHPCAGCDHRFAQFKKHFCLVVPMVAEEWLTPRPPDVEHQLWTPSPRFLRLSLPTTRRQTPAAKTRRRENHLPRHVDQHLLLAPAQHPITGIVVALFTRAILREPRNRRKIILAVGRGESMLRGVYVGAVR